MTRSVILCITILVSTFAWSQDSDPAIAIGKMEVEDNTYASRSLASKLSSRLGKDFTIDNTAFFTLSSNISFGKMHTINGMDTYTTTDANVTYTIDGKGLAAEKLNTTVGVKGRSEKDLVSKIGTSLIRDSKHYNELSSFIQAYIKKSFGTCAKVSSAINKQLQDSKAQTAYSMLAYYDSLEGCEAEKARQEDAIIAKHQEYVCTKIVQDAEVLANSGNERSMGKAIDLLLMIPPDAPCAKDAIRISELVNTNAAELSKYSAQKIQDRIVIRNTMSHSDWKQYYRTNYSKYSEF